jgi:uncharacterized membrane protein
MALLAIFTAVCSYFKLDFVPYVVSFSVIVVLIVSSFNKIPERLFPIFLIGLALSMLWQQTMLGSYIVGTDIHGEYYIANETINHGWNLSYFHLNVTSIVINVFTPFLHWIGIPVVWQFKLIYPMILSVVPFILYLAFSKQFTKKTAFYSALFFMVVPVFTVEIAGIVKSMVAEVFFALIVLVLFSKMSDIKRTALLIIFGLLAIMSHYTVGTIIVAYLGIIAVILIGYKIHTKKNNYIPILIAVIVIIVIGAMWLKNTGGGIVYTGYTHSYEGVQLKTNEALTNNAVSDETYMDNQDTLVQTALGMDWNEVSIWGKLFRVMQYITQLSIILGFVYLMVYRKKYNVSFKFLAAIFASAVILGMVLFIPQFANTINTTRWYHFALFFISPLFVVGLMQLGKEKLVAGVLIIYYVFTSGLVFHLANSDIPKSKIEVPYSIAYDHDKGIVGLFDANDIECAKWLVENRNGLNVYVSYMSTYLPLEFEDWFEQYKEVEPQKPYLLFLTSQDLELGKWTRGTDAGMRSYNDLPNTQGLQELHRNGKAVVYYAR